MDIKAAIEGLSALAQETRLAAFRHLVKAGAEGCAAGEIARRLRIPNNTLSTHLGILSRAGLIASRREGRHIIYHVDFDGTRKLLGFLLEDCCQGAPQACDSALDTVLVNCC